MPPPQAEVDKVALNEYLTLGQDVYTYKRLYSPHKAANSTQRNVYNTRTEKARILLDQAQSG